MEYRPLEIKVLEAKGLKNVNFFTKMDVYVVVTISCDPRTAQKTPVDKDGGTSPKWNYFMKFTVDDAMAQQNRIGLHFRLRSNRTFGDRDIGEVYVPMKELLDDADDDKVVSYQVMKKRSGKPKGTLSFSYKFGEKFSLPAPEAMKAAEPVMAYPAMAVGAGTSSGYAYPPAGGGYPQPGAYPHPGGAYPYGTHTGYKQGGAYGHLPPTGYGYGYGYPQQQVQVQQPPKKKSKMGMGLGMGLGAGLLGGLLIGDVVGDAASYGAGYDAGFDDGLDF